MHVWFWCSHALQSRSQWLHSRIHHMSEIWTYLSVCKWKNEMIWYSEVFYQIDFCVPNIPWALKGKMCVCVCVCVCACMHVCTFVCAWGEGGECVLFQLLTYLFYRKGHHFSCCSWWDSSQLSRANTCVQPKSLSAFSHGGWQKGSVIFQ
jgi:hypothetical protein